MHANKDETVEVNEWYQIRHQAIWLGELKWSIRKSSQKMKVMKAKMKMKTPRRSRKMKKTIMMMTQRRVKKKMMMMKSLRRAKRTSPAHLARRRWG